MTALATESGTGEVTAPQGEARSAGGVTRGEMGEDSMPHRLQEVVLSSRHHLQPRIREGLLPCPPVFGSGLRITRSEQEKRLRTNGLEIEPLGQVVCERGRDKHQSRKIGVLLGQPQGDQAPGRPADNPDGSVYPAINECDPSLRRDFRSRVGEGFTFGKEDHHMTLAHHAGQPTAGEAAALPQLAESVGGSVYLRIATPG